MVDKVETPSEVIRREAELMKTLHHENIVRFHAVYFERCFVCIVVKGPKFPIPDGCPIHSQCQERGKINARDIIHVSYQMVASIQYLHGKHIVHRDIKGDNFLLTIRDFRDPHHGTSDGGIPEKFCLCGLYDDRMLRCFCLSYKKPPRDGHAFVLGCLLCSAEHIVDFVYRSADQSGHERHQALEPERVRFAASGWRITLDRPDSNADYRNAHFLRKVNTPCSRHCSRLLQILRLESCFRRRVRIVELEHEEQEQRLNAASFAGCVWQGQMPLQDASVLFDRISDLHLAPKCMQIKRQIGTQEGQVEPEANGLVKGWTYYASSKEEGPELPQRALRSRSATGPQIHGQLEIDKSSSLSWFVSLILTLAIMAGGVWFFVACIQMGISSFTANLSDYKTGVMDFLDLIKPIFPEKEIQKKATEFLNNELPTLAQQVASSLESLSFQALMFFVYLFFWIFEPLPISSPVAEVFKSYLLLKTIVCLLFASLMSALLMCLQCKIWSLFFVLTFLLNFIPEIGAIASAILTVPAILFDGHLDRQMRLENLLWLVIIGTCIKIFTGNVVEVQMYASLGGQFMRMHPVIIMAGAQILRRFVDQIGRGAAKALIMLFSALLGVTGMFLAVPTMAAVKYYLVSTDMPKQFRNPLLIFIEGDATAPHKNFVEQQRLIECHFMEPPAPTRQALQDEEAIFAKDYGLKVDIWALGIIMYGLLDGRFPFKDETEIKIKEPKFPRRLEPLCQDFISSMLHKDEKQRASADDVIVHGWLHQTDDGITPKQRSDSKEGRSADEVHPFQHEEQNHGVTERRRELVERLNNEHGQKPTTLGFMHCASLTEFSVPDRRLPGAQWHYQWFARASETSQIVPLRGSHVAVSNRHKPMRLRHFKPIPN
eukprot:g22736.t1